MIMEEKINQNEENLKKHSLASKLIFAIALILAAAIILGIISTGILLCFPVKQIEVSGDSRYTYSEIIEASGIKSGARLYFLNEKKAERALLASFPYLKDVKINSYFPNRVKIDIEEFEDIYLVPHVNGFCYVNGDFEILEIIESAPEYERFSGIFIKLEFPIEGEIGALSMNDDAQRATELIEFIKEYGFYSHLNIVDVENKYDNAFIVDKQYKFIIGSMTDISEKIDVAFKVCFSNSFVKENNAIIDATDKKKVTLRYVDDENIRLEFDFCQK